MANNLMKVSEWLLVLGGINWGLTVFGWDLVSTLADATKDWVGTTVYGAIGVAGVYVGYKMLTDKKKG